MNPEKRGEKEKVHSVTQRLLNVVKQDFEGHPGPAVTPHPAPGGIAVASAGSGSSWLKRVRRRRTVWPGR